MLEITIDNCYKCDLETINDPNNICDEKEFILMSEKIITQQLKEENEKLNVNENENENENEK